MARNLTTGMINAYIGKVVRPIFLVQLGTSQGTVYAWSGYGTIVWNGNSYVGTGTFGGIDVVAETSDLAAVGVKFSLAGVDPGNLQIALNDIQQGLQADLYLGALDATGNVIDSPYLLFSGLTDVPNIDEGDDSACAISISVESELINLARAQERRYTTQDQQIDHPGDNGFKYVPALQNQTVRFG